MGSSAEIRCVSSTHSEHHVWHTEAETCCKPHHEAGSSRPATCREGLPGLRPAPSTEKCSGMLSGDRGNHVALHMDSSESAVRGEREPITGISRGPFATPLFLFNDNVDCCEAATQRAPRRRETGVKLFQKKIRILIIDDQGAVLEKLKRRIAIFWPPDIPAKTVAMYCAWADEAIEALKEYQPDVLLLNYKFRRDAKTGRDVALWIEQNYRKRIVVAAHSADYSEEDLRQLFQGTECVKYFLCGERIRDFIEDCTRKESADGY